MGYASVLILLCFPALLGAHFVITEIEALNQQPSVRSPQKRSTHDVSAFDVEVYSVKVDCKVTSRFAHNVMSSRAVNRANVSKEANFKVELPKTAFITNFSMTIDEVVYVGVVKEKEVAQKQYEKAVSKGQTAGLVKASGTKMEQFTVSVNVAAFSKVTFELTYEELLKRHKGHYEMLIRVKPNQVVNHFEINVDIYEPQGIHFLDAHGTFITNDLLPLVQKTVTGNKGHIFFSPTMEEQRSCPFCDTTLIDGDFIIKYDVNREQSAGSIQIVNGYFVHFFAPINLPQISKDVVFVVDESGSMWGNKIRQTKEALLVIMDDVHGEDYFNIIMFDHDIRPWKKTLVKATSENIQEAKETIKKIEPRGSTDINEAILDAVNILKDSRKMQQLPENSVSMIILLTDGDPTSGEVNKNKIQENIKNAIAGEINLYCLGFGEYLDFNFLEKLALENSGVARRIYEKSDASLQIQGFYDEVASPLLSKIQMQYPENAITDLTENTFRQYYNGSEIIVAGHITDNDLQDFSVDVSASGILGKQNLKLETKIAENEEAFKSQQYIFGEYTERLWAYLTIEQLLEKRTSGSEEEKNSTTSKALQLSLQYNFVTPLTSMVVTKPSEEDSVMIARKPNGEALEEVQTVHHDVGYSFGHSVKYVDGDPHFMIPVPAKNDNICFNIDEKPGVIFNLVKDPVTGIVVNAETIGDKKVIPGKKQHTYFGKIALLNNKLDVKIEVSTQIIKVYYGEKYTYFTWTQVASLKQKSFDVITDKDKTLRVVFEGMAQFVILLHRVWKLHPLQQDYLGFYIIDDHQLSKQTHGLLGQFYSGVDFEVIEIHEGENSDKPDASMLIKGKVLTVTRGWQKEYRKDIKHGEDIPCWFIHKNGTGFIDGVPRDYIVSGIFESK
ncbi:inter-alpha-trypsin inhibitor heavy chain H3-like [Polypterus senegalus]|nr:inter-alpha-trypsin inhibitor heavy chain H3-like [Polypterus senegalus]